MEKAHRISTFVQLGKVFKDLSMENPWSGHESGLTADEYNRFDQLIQLAHLKNGWFTEQNVRKSLGALAQILEKDILEKFLDGYDIETKNKKVAIIMAGNIPLVGFHDLMCVLLSGHQALVKPSSDDANLTVGVIKVLTALNETLKDRIEVENGQLKAFDAVIATGSNNSARYFEQYFGKYPHIIRKSRTSLAIIEGTETEDELKALTDDIFDYFGLGCRSISKVYVPEGYNLDLLFNAFYEQKDIIHHHKYANNYDYHKAIFLMNKDEILENGFLLLKEDEKLFSPLATLYYERYDSLADVQKKIANEKEHIQAIVGKKYIPFGQSQFPGIEDYADDINTMQFLNELK